jgi:MFS transporter, Spinster family, sphingosine-1-phosphate transporter
VLAPALVADWFPAGAERTNALGFFCVSQPLGAAAGFVYAGEVSRLLGWRYAFRLSPFLSFALSAVLLLTVAEPDRGGVDGVAPAAVRATDNSAAKASWVRDVRAILGTRSFFLSTIGAVGMTFTSGAIAQWAPAYMQRVSCVTSDDDCAASVTRTFGLVTMATGVIGTVTGSQVARWYAKRNHAADAVVCALGLLLATPCVYAAIYLAPVRPGTPTWTAVFLGEVLVSMVWAPNTAILLSVVSAHRRSTATSISLLTTHLFGDSMSPVLIGACADWLHASTVYKMSKAVSLQYALYLSVVSTVVGSVFFMAAGAHLEGDRARAVIGYEPVDSGAASDTTVVAQAEADPPGGESKRGGRGAVFTLLDDSPRDGTAVAAAAAARSGRSGLSSMHCLAASASPPRR